MKSLLAAIILLALLAGRAAAAWSVQRYDTADCPHDTDFSAYLRASAPPREKKNSWLPGISPGWPLRTGRWTITWKGTF